MDLEQRLHAAYGAFKAKASDTEVARFQGMLKSIHEDAWSAIQGEKQLVHGAEFAHGLSILEPELSHLDSLPKDPAELPTKVEPDGTMLGVGKWELLDPGWVESLAGWLEHLDDRAPFNTSPVLTSIPDKVSLCIAGDWGTGPWRTSPKSPSDAVGAEMAKLAPEITLHLGDVYYAGSSEQEKANLIDIWPKGNIGSYTLNSNHEMYDGALSYFAALASDFTDQKGCSYFALQNSDWLIVGLDTAYHSDPWNLYMQGALGPDQTAWLKSLPSKQGIIIASHHTGFDLTGATTTALYGEVMDALAGADGNCRYKNVYWYWGHAHNAVVYKDRLTGGTTLKTRCIGHAAIPYGNASELVGQQQVAWYETKAAGDADIPLRVLCGFAHVGLSGPTLSEALIGEDGTTRWTPDKMS